MFFLLLILISMDWIRIHIIYPFTEFKQLPTYSDQWWLYNALFVFLTPVQGCNKDSNNAAALVSTSKISDFYGVSSMLFGISVFDTKYTICGVLVEYEALCCCVGGGDIISQTQSNYDSTCSKWF